MLLCTSIHTASYWYMYVGVLILFYKKQPMKRGDIPSQQNDASYTSGEKTVKVPRIHSALPCFRLLCFHLLCFHK